jgi:hypothetical protein
VGIAIQLFGVPEQFNRGGDYMKTFLCVLALAACLFVAPSAEAFPLRQRVQVQRVQVQRVQVQRVQVQQFAVQKIVQPVVVQPVYAAPAIVQPFYAPFAVQAVTVYP